MKTPEGYQFVELSQSELNDINGGQTHLPGTILSDTINGIHSQATFGDKVLGFRDLSLPEQEFLLFKCTGC